MNNLPKKEVIDFVLKEGKNSTSFLTLYPGFQYFEKEIRGEHGLIAYMNSTTAWIGASDPVCSSPSIMEELIFAFFEEAKKNRKSAMILPVTKQVAELARKNNFFALQIGSEPWYDLYQTSAKIPSVKQLLTKGAVAQSFDPAKIESREYIEIESVSKSWLKDKNMLPLGFLNRLEPWIHLQHKKFFRVIFNGHQVGFLVAVPTRNHRAWYLVDLIRLPTAPAGTTELLIQEAMKELKVAGAEEVTLGLCPFLLLDDEEKKINPQGFKNIDYCFKNFNFFYGFKYLFQYKEKFNPTSWEPLYLIASKPKLNILSYYSLFKVLLPHGFFSILFSIISNLIKQFNIENLYSKLFTNKIVLRGFPKSILEFCFRMKVTLSLLVINILFYSVANKNYGDLNANFIENYAYQWNRLIDYGLSLKSIQMLIIPSLLHWQLLHLCSNLFILLTFVGLLELLVGSAIVSITYLFGVLFSNPLTTMIIMPFMYLHSADSVTEFGQVLDVGSSLGIFSCLGVLIYLSRFFKTFLTLTIVGIFIAAYVQQDLLSLNHLTAIAIGIGLARFFIPKELT